MFLKASEIDSATFFEVKVECRVSCVKLVVWSIVAQKGTDILIFYIFQYDAEYGSECYWKFTGNIKSYWNNFIT